VTDFDMPLLQTWCFYVRQMYVTFKNSKESSDLAVHSTSRYFTTATNVPISMCICINGDKIAMQ